MKKHVHQHIFVILFAIAYLLAPSTAQATDVSVQATLQPKQFTLGQDARLTITINGASSAKPEDPQGDGLRFIYRGQSTRMQWINGKSSSSVSFAYQVQAVKPGSHTIAPVTIRVDDRAYSTKAIKCTVSPAAASPAPQPGNRKGGRAVKPPTSTRLRSGVADKIGFMRILPKKKTVYAGERVPFTLKAYFRQGMRVTIKSNPRLVNNTFILQSLDDKPMQSEEIVNGIPYTLLTWHGAISAVKQGDFPLEMELDTSLLVRNRRQRPSSMFGSPLFDDPFFDNFFSGYTQKDITLLSPKQDIRVMDLPIKGRPKQFSGAIGSFSLAVNARPTTVVPGDPISLHMIIQGNGNFDRVKAPTFTGKKNNWKTYPPSAGKPDSTDTTTKKEFEQAVIPTTQDIDHIPPVSFTYFDPMIKKYITVNSDPIAITVKAGTTTPQPLSDSRAAPKQQLQSTPKENEISTVVPAPIHTSFGKPVPALHPLYRQPWFQLLAALSLVLFCTALALVWRNKRLQAHPELTRKKQISKKMMQLLAEVKPAMQNQDSLRFLMLCRRLLQEHFGFAWQMEPRAISAADLQQRLGNDSPLLDIFQKAEHAAYTGQKISEQEMKEIYRRIEQEVAQ